MPSARSARLQHFETANRYVNWYVQFVLLPNQHCFAIKKWHSYGASLLTINSKHQHLKSNSREIRTLHIFYLQ